MLKGVVIGSSLIKYATGARILRHHDVCTFSFLGGSVADLRLIFEQLRGQTLHFVVVQIGTNDVSDIAGRHESCDVVSRLSLLRDLVAGFVSKFPGCLVILSEVPPRDSRKPEANLILKKWNRQLRRMFYDIPQVVIHKFVSNFFTNL